MTRQDTRKGERREIGAGRNLAEDFPPIARPQIGEDERNVPDIGRADFDAVQKNTARPASASAMTAAPHRASAV